jgi:UDP-GlcNAc:undecaprenyl-phosphate GlcNAc-1-phosphate transferase
MSFLIASLATLLLAVLLTLLTRRAAHRFGAIVTPRQNRWHDRPTAMLGGIAIYAAFALGYLLFTPGLRSAFPIIAAASLLFLTGLVDDLVEIKPYTKLVVQLIAAAIPVYYGLHLPWTGNEAVNDLLTILWLVGITNAINLLDNMDGLAAGISAIATAFLVVTFLLNGEGEVALMAAILGCSALGFLAFNFHPASIFMGDCGSMFLGFMLGGTALLSSYGRSRSIAAVLLTPVLILLIPIFDTCVVTITRKLSGRPISQGGRDHTSHRLVALGVSQRRAVLIFYLVAAISGLLALSVRFLQAETVLLLVPSFALTILFLGLYLGKVRVYEAAEPPPANTIIRVLADFSYKRRIFEVMLDLVLVVLAYYGAYLLRFDGDLGGDQLAILKRTLPVVIVIQMLCFLIGGMYRGIWRYAGIADLLTIGKSVFASLVLTSCAVMGMYGFRGPSRAVLVLDGLLLLFFVGASRVSFRLLRTAIVGRSNHRPDAKPVLIYGAGDGGELLIREIINNPDHLYTPIGFIDDDQRKAGKLIHGIRVFDAREVQDLVRAHSVCEVLVSSLKVPKSKIDDLQRLGIGLKKMSIRIE